MEEGKVPLNFYGLYISEINILVYLEIIFSSSSRYDNYINLFCLMFSPMSDIFATRISKGLAIAYGLFSYALTFFVQNIPGLVQVG